MDDNVQTWVRDEDALDVTLDLKMALDTHQIFIVAPMKHHTKGLGWVVALITREFMYNQCAPILEIIDDTIEYHTLTSDDDTSHGYVDPQY